MAKKLKATAFIKPYNGKKYSIKANGCGVYIIKKNGVYMYIGKSYKIVRDTMYRHFQLWNDYRNNWVRKLTGFDYDRVTYYGQDRSEFTVKIIYCNTERQATVLEQALIIKHKPKDNLQKLRSYSETEYLKAIGMYEDAEDYVPF